MKTMQKHSCTTELRNVHLKATPARLGVLSILEHSDKPVDVQDVIEHLENNHIDVDKVTVFRIMNSLTEKGLATPIQFNEGKLRYEHSKRADHHHFVCENCGEITDISDCNIHELEKNIQKQKRLLIKRHSLEFFGLCENCQS